MVLTAGIATALMMMANSHASADQPTLDELLELEPRPEPREPADADESADDPEAAGPLELDDDVRQMLRGEEPADVFEQAIRQMDAVSQRLGRDLDPGLATQREQESILAKLEQVIEAARQQQMSSSGQGSGEPGGQAREQDGGGEDPSQQGQPGDQGQGEAASQGQANGQGEHDGQASPGSVRDGERDDRLIDELRREWGQLPPRLRDEISEGLQERFSPAYRSLTEAYYRRLAEEE